MKVNNEKKTKVSTKKTKERFETPTIEIIKFTTDDVITISGGFPGEDDPI